MIESHITINESHELDLELNPQPTGDLYLKQPALPSNTNSHGDIYGGWVMSQMDLAATQMATEIADGRVANVGISALAFLRPVPIGSMIEIYCDLLSVGRTSIEITVEVWITPPNSHQEKQKLTESNFCFVAIDLEGRTRRINSSF